MRENRYFLILCRKYHTRQIINTHFLSFCRNCAAWCGRRRRIRCRTLWRWVGPSSRAIRPTTTTTSTAAAARATVWRTGSATRRGRRRRWPTCSAPRTPAWSPTSTGPSSWTRKSSTQWWVDPESVYSFSAGAGGSKWQSWASSTIEFAND